MINPEYIPPPKKKPSYERGIHIEGWWISVIGAIFRAFGGM